MSALFEPKSIGAITVRNAFVHSATYECMADRQGRVTDPLIHRYRRLAKGGVGLIIPGYCYVSPNGRSAAYQTGIHEDAMIDGLKTLVDAVHAEGGKLAFQLMHAGRQTTQETIGQRQMAPSKGPMDSIFMARPREMTDREIKAVIHAFGAAADRARRSGAEGSLARLGSPPGSLTSDSSPASSQSW